MPAQTVTLLTGDRITISGDSTVAIRQAPGRERIGFSTFKGAGHLYAIPSDAARLVANGKLDRRLCDLTLLVDNKYDGAAPEMPLGMESRRRVPGVHLNHARPPAA